MWRPVTVTAAPTEEPLSLDDAKAHLNVLHDDDDDLIASHLAAARSHVETATGTRLCTQTVTARTDNWCDLARLPVAPVRALTSIAYVDAAGGAQTLSPSVYDARLEGLEPTVVLNAGRVWPARAPGSLITVTAEVGYGEAADQPQAVVQALKLLIAGFYADREGGSLSAAVEALLAGHKTFLI